MPSLRLILVITYTLFVCYLGWRKRSYLLPSAQPILFLVWFSCAIDILALICYREGLPHEPLQHLFTLIEFLCQATYISVSLIQRKGRITLSIATMLFCVAWLAFNAQAGALAKGDEPLVILSGATMNFFLVLALRERLSCAAQSLASEWSLSVSVLIRQTAQQLVTTQHGKIFCGLFLYNFLALCIFAVELLYNLDTRWAHSSAHIMKNTFFLFAFLYREYD